MVGRWYAERRKGKGGGIVVIEIEIEEEGEVGAVIVNDTHGIGGMMTRSGEAIAGMDLGRERGTGTDIGFHSEDHDHDHDHGAMSDGKRTIDTRGIGKRGAIRPTADEGKSQEIGTTIDGAEAVKTSLATPPIPGSRTVVPQSRMSDDKTQTPFPTNIVRFLLKQPLPYNPPPANPTQ